MPPAHPYHTSAQSPNTRPACTYAEESLLLIALQRTLWRLSYQDMRDWLVAWPALAEACALPLDAGYGGRRAASLPAPGHGLAEKRGHRV